MKNEVQKLLKVVYFDESSAIDYLDIYNGGLKVEVSGKQKKRRTFTGAGGEAGVKTGILFKALQPFLNIKASVQAEGHLSRIGESIIQTTISNTVLSDYLKTAGEDKNIIQIEKYQVSAYKNSISFMKMYTPYLNMIDMDNAGIRFSELDSILEKGKGYYELVAEGEEEKIILRFNMHAFRNNYNLVDLTKMDLKFYSVEVGKMFLGDLDAENEFDLNKEKILTSADLLDTKTENRLDEVKVYDVILAGIKPRE